MTRVKELEQQIVALQAELRSLLAQEKAVELEELKKRFKFCDTVVSFESDGIREFEEELTWLRFYSCFQKPAYILRITL